VIVGLEGILVRKEPTYVHLKVGGITYNVAVSVHCSSEMKTKEVSLHITNVIREDANLFFGFIDTNEQIVFNRVLKISGVGPSTALAICSTFTPSQFSTIVRSEDVNSLKSVPGIGPKSAKRILVELSDFELGLVNDAGTNINNDALGALESLGFKKDKIVSVLKVCKSTEIGALVKEALQKLSK